MRRHSLAKRLAELLLAGDSVLRKRCPFLGSRTYKIVPRQVLHARPLIWCCGSKNLSEHMELMNLVVSLKHGTTGEELQKNTAVHGRKRYDPANKRAVIRVVNQLVITTYPAPHMSTSGPYFVAPNSNSGGLYQSVTTRLV